MSVYFMHVLQYSNGELHYPEVPKGLMIYFVVENNNSMGAFCTNYRSVNMTTTPIIKILYRSHIHTIQLVIIYVTNIPSYYT